MQTQRRQKLLAPSDNNFIVTPVSHPFMSKLQSSLARGARGGGRGKDWGVSASHALNPRLMRPFAAGLGNAQKFQADSRLTRPGIRQFWVFKCIYVLTFGDWVRDTH